MSTDAIVRVDGFGIDSLGRYSKPQGNAFITNLGGGLSVEMDDGGNKEKKSASLPDSSGGSGNAGPCQR